ncbi:TauD/TfdA dioxygenase family protein [Chitinasiproducens palmae]|uniref:Taurine dioxygenase n=1 Tax=Chitinasiproducens palmae TaxID=1770053 RepID=A0A1H2PV25_9BURK|nr:TauD/TfdA family dioxygenase [Chitinasiproducens palmae]SDV50731.1 taurine dioxygenase [Chitinasiproducens palmae]
MIIQPTGKTLGACVEDIDLAKPIDADTFACLRRALGEHGVLWYPRQQLDAAALKRFAALFGTLEINVANSYQEPGIPEVMILSNIVRDGKPIGLSDAGQSWHTDMSYSSTIAFTNILYGIEIPFRDGRSLGNTEFCNMHAAYDELPDALKTRLDGMTIEHDFNKFWEMMRREKGSTRPPLTPAQRAAKPPVSHPVFLRHPITGRKVLYANPGYAMRINELPEEESVRTLAFLFEHQLQDKYRYKHDWQVGDVLMWDNIGTIHNAVADYRPDEPRLIKRCQVMADKVFEEVA